MKMGVDYYPEHWDETRWGVDADLMAKAGITVVRLAEFAWSRMEPVEDCYDFAWLDRAIATLASRGIDVVLGTPTATPPAWLMERHPDISPVDAQGNVKSFGTRVDRCLTNPEFRRYSRAITRAMVDHYAGNEAVIGWQTDNEFEANECYCHHCCAAWHSWLRARYGSVGELNKAWGTVFWSQEYSAWSQVPLPRDARYGRLAHNPSLLLDYQRFASGTTVSFQQEQIDVIRAAKRAWFVTHNYMGMWHWPLDHYDAAANLDFISWDNYPGGSESFEGPLQGSALSHDLMRGLKQRNFWVMEQRSGPTGWNTMSATTRPGELRVYAWQSVSRGADAVVFFRWRSCLSGTEQYWHGVIGHDARPGRRYHEVAALGAEFAALAPWLDGTSPKPRVALIHSYPNSWAFHIQPQAPGMEYLLLHTRFHAALTSLGVGVDMVPETVDLTGYDLVVVPAHYLLSPEFAAKLAAYVEAGGTLVTSSRTGVKNMANVCVQEPLPGLLRPLCGVTVDEYDAVGPRKLPLVAPWGGQYEAAIWCDILSLEGAEALATYGEHAGNRGFYAGAPALTVNRRGRGRCYYLATVPEEPFLVDFLAHELLPAAGVACLRDLPSGVETMTREADGRSLRFLLNFNRHGVSVNVPKGSKALLLPGVAAGEPTDIAGDVVVLPAYEVAILLE